MTPGIHSKLRDDESEHALVGSLLIDPRRIADVVRIVRPEHFFDGLYRAIFEAASDLHRRQQLVEVISVLRMVRDRKDLAMAQGTAEAMADAGIFADHITRSTITAAHAVYYARMVAQTGLRREIAAKASLLHEASDTERDATFGEIVAMEQELGQLDRDMEGPRLLADECARYVRDLGRHESKLQTLGLPGLDECIGGGASLGELVVIGARPSHGKSMCAMQILEHVASKGVAGIIVSEEMSSQLLAGRSLLHQTDIASVHWQKRTQELLHHSEDFFRGRAPITIADPCGTVKRAVAQIEQAAATGAKVFVVDYAQLLSGKGNTRYEQVTNVSMELKKVCTRCEMLGVMLCQLSRPDKARQATKDDGYLRGVRPRLTDLRDSGQIEQDADVILFLQWPLKENAGYKPFDRYFIYVGKNRNRPTHASEVQCRIVPSRQLLEPLGTPQEGDPEYHEPYKDLAEWN